MTLVTALTTLEVLSWKPSLREVLNSKRIALNSANDMLARLHTWVGEVAGYACNLKEPIAATLEHATEALSSSDSIQEVL